MRITPNEVYRIGKEAVRHGIRSLQPDAWEISPGFEAPPFDQETMNKLDDHRRPHRRSVSFTEKLWYKLQYLAGDLELTIPVFIQEKLEYLYNGGDDPEEGKGENRAQTADIGTARRLAAQYGWKDKFAAELAEAQAKISATVSERDTLVSDWIERCEIEATIWDDLGAQLTKEDHEARSVAAQDRLDKERQKYMPGGSL